MKLYKYTLFQSRLEINADNGGFDDPRVKLFFEIIKVIEAKNPTLRIERFFTLEGMVLEDIDNYSEKKECVYKNEKYAVRDNGAVLRYPRENKRVRLSDNKWTYGKVDTTTGYMDIAGERVHRIVATAFHGDPPEKSYIADHIDTNRQNNRPDNLRWVTKFENIILNPITCKKIECACGCSIEEVLNDISILQRANLIQEFSWMREVSETEAQVSRERLLAWAKSNKKPSGGSMGEWIFAGRAKSKFLQPMEQAVAATLETNGASCRIRYSRENASKYPKELPDYLAALTDVIRQKTKGEIIGSIQQLLMAEPSIMLPDVVLQTCGGGILIEKAHLEQFDDVEFVFEGKVRTPQKIVFKKDDYGLVVIIRLSGVVNKDAVEQCKLSKIDAIEVDLTWAKEGLGEEELAKVLRANCSKKKWLNNAKIDIAKEKLIKICEPIVLSGRGVAHMYVANCPLMTEPSNGRNDADLMLDCGFCDYQFENEAKEGGCFGKSRIDTYEDLLSVIELERQDDQIIKIAFKKNDETVVKEFMFHDEETDALGKTLLEIWDKKNKSSLIAHNVVSGWYVLIEEDPRKSLSEKGFIYAKISKSINDLSSKYVRSIYGYDEKEWKFIK